jgi:ketosteroid isomerase-like protein
VTKREDKRALLDYLAQDMVAMHDSGVTGFWEYQGSLTDDEALDVLRAASERIKSMPVPRSKRPAA